VLSFLSSLLFASLLGVAIPPPVTISDAEVPKYLNNLELSEWGRSKRLFEAGQSRLQKGQSMMNAPAISLEGSFKESPEVVKARAQKVIDEGQTQMAQAATSLGRLRSVANTRFLEETKTITLTGESDFRKWDIALSLSAVRLQKASRDMGFKENHLVGSIQFLFDNRGLRSRSLTDALRTTWNKLDAGFLANQPLGGYRLTSGPSSRQPPSLSSDWKTPRGPRETSIIWAELYSVSPDNSSALLFVCLADASTMQVVASEFYLTTFGPTISTSKYKSARFYLRDEKSFLPRLSKAGGVNTSLANQRMGESILRQILVRFPEIRITSRVSLAALFSEVEEGWDMGMTKSQLGFSADPQGQGEAKWLYLVQKKASPSSANLEIVGPLTLELEPLETSKPKP